MIHPIPPGTRDILPDEMRELRRLHLAMIEVFEDRGYGEVSTPAIEYDEVLARGDVTKKLTVRAHKFSGKAAEKIAAAGGAAEVLGAA